MNIQSFPPLAINRPQRHYYTSIALSTINAGASGDISQPVQIQCADINFPIKEVKIYASYYIVSAPVGGAVNPIYINIQSDVIPQYGWDIIAICDRFASSNATFYTFYTDGQRLQSHYIYREPIKLPAFNISYSTHSINPANDATLLANSSIVNLHFEFLG